MIWGDPWIAAATDKGGYARQFCTTIPPPMVTLGTGQRFVCVRVRDLDLQSWRDLVGTRWSAAALTERLAEAWIPCLFTEERGLVATCVLRPQVDGVWILETMRAIPGYGAPLMRALMCWIWDRVGPFVLGFTWELTVAQLGAAWWRGWLGAAAAYQYGWAFSVDGCHFCGLQESWTPMSAPRFTLPTLIQDEKGGWSAVVSDSGLGDGWGYVSHWSGPVDWSAVSERGGWRALWCRSQWAPAPKWSWTGEIVVVGLLNAWCSDYYSVEWVTAEIALG
jgi:hypothetical protein